MKISINVIAMLTAFIALIAMVDAFIGQVGIISSNIGHSVGFSSINLNHLCLNDLLGTIFSVFAWLMGVPWNEAHTVGSLMGTKMIANEFVAYMNLTPIRHGTSKVVLSHKSIVIATFALCGFANFGSVAMQVGGIGELAPSRRK